MTRLDGRVHLTPRDPEDWLRQIAAALPRIHELDVPVPAEEHRVDPEKLSRRPAADGLARSN